MYIIGENLRFFNIDLHISVIADLKQIFSNLGHTVDDVCLSNHSFIFNRNRDRIDVINQNNWPLLDKSMCDSFYNRYNNELSEYDGFICTYPPSFSLLYEKFNKPIIIQCPIRFEIPFVNDKDRLNWFLDYLKDGIDSRRIIPVANNLYDKKYCEECTGREWIYIPNLCEYTGINYQGSEYFLLASKSKFRVNHLKIKNKEEYLGPNYKWCRLNNIAGIINIPYNVSTMSNFENYTGNIPLFYPTPEFNLELYRKGLSLSELSWSTTDKDTLEWIKLADYYNEEWMPYITYFNSLYNLKFLIDNINLEGISNKMREFNKVRKARIYEMWTSILSF